MSYVLVFILFAKDGFHVEEHWNHPAKSNYEQCEAKKEAYLKLDNTGRLDAICVLDFED